MFPFSGGTLPEVPALAARQVFAKPYRLIYFVGDEEVTIVTVRHSSESLAEYPERLLAVTDE